MKPKTNHYSWLVLSLLGGTLMLTSCSSKQQAAPEKEKTLTTVGNPYLPLWEHIPDGEPYVFEDPDQPGKYRVYIYGSHDSRITDYCGREQVVWSASVDSLNNWRYDGEILAVSKNAKGELINKDSLADVLFAPDVTLVTDKTTSMVGAMDSLPKATVPTDLLRYATGARTTPMPLMVF